MRGRVRLGEEAHDEGSRSSGIPIAAMLHKMTIPT